jgi:hypothetical protein
MLTSGNGWVTYPDSSAVESLAIRGEIVDWSEAKMAGTEVRI